MASPHREEAAPYARSNDAHLQHIDKHRPGKFGIQLLTSAWIDRGLLACMVSLSLNKMPTPSSPAPPNELAIQIARISTVTATAIAVADMIGIGVFTSLGFQV